MPNIKVPPYPMIVHLHPFTREGILDKYIGMNSGVPVSTTYPTANMAIYIPVFLPFPMLVNQVWWQNGATLTNSPNADIGIYWKTGKKIYSMGPTVMTGANVIQRTNITDFWLPAGPFYIAFACDQTTNATIFASAMSSLSCAIATGMKQQTSAFALPDPIVPAQAAQNLIPMFGFTQRATI